MDDTYYPAEFASCFSRRGYGKKKDALKWLAENNMQIAQELDFQRCYNELNARKIQRHGKRYIAMTSDGKNLSDPEYQPNSKPPFAKGGRKG